MPLTFAYMRFGYRQVSFQGRTIHTPH
jgi:hypothetical protein